MVNNIVMLIAGAGVLLAVAAVVIFILQKTVLRKKDVDSSVQPVGRAADSREEERMRAQPAHRRGSPQSAVSRSRSGKGTPGVVKEASGAVTSPPNDKIQSQSSRKETEMAAKKKSAKPTTPHAVAFVLLHMAVADGDMHENEVQKILQVLSKYVGGSDPGKVKQILDETVVMAESLEAEQVLALLKQNLKLHEQVDLLTDLMELAGVDGDLCTEEAQQLALLHNELGVDTALRDLVEAAEAPGTEVENSNGKSTEPIEGTIKAVASCYMAMSGVDGEVDEREGKKVLALLSGYGEQIGAERLAALAGEAADEYNEAVEANRLGEKLNECVAALQGSLNETQKRELLAGLEAIAKADKKLTQEEKELLENFREAFSPGPGTGAKGKSAKLTPANSEPDLMMMHVLYFLLLTVAHSGQPWKKGPRGSLPGVFDPDRGGAPSMSTESSPSSVLECTLQWLQETDEARNRYFLETQNWWAGFADEEKRLEKALHFASELKEKYPQTGRDQLMWDLFFVARLDGKYLDTPKRKELVDRLADMLGVSIQYHVKPGMHLVGQRLHFFMSEVEFGPDGKPVVAAGDKDAQSTKSTSTNSMRKPSLGEDLTSITLIHYFFHILLTVAHHGLPWKKAPGQAPSRVFDCTVEWTGQSEEDRKRYFNEAQKAWEEMADERERAEKAVEVASWLKENCPQTGLEKLIGDIVLVAGLDGKSSGASGRDELVDRIADALGLPIHGDTLNACSDPPYPGEFYFVTPYYELKPLRIRLLKRVPGVDTLLRKFSPEEVEAIASAILLTKTLPRLKFVDEALRKKYECDFKGAIWFIPFVVYAESTGGVLVIDQNGVYGNALEDEGVIGGLFSYRYFSNREFYDGCEEDIGENDPGVRTLCITMEEEGGVLTINEFPGVEHGSQFYILEAIFKLLDDLREASESDGIWDFEAAGISNKTFENWEDLLSWSGPKAYDRELILSAVRRSGYNLKWASDELRCDREFVLDAVKENGYALAEASEGLQDDREVVLAAIRTHGYVLTFASERLQRDRELVLEAVSRDNAAIESASDDLKNDREIALAAVSYSGYALKALSVTMQADREIVLKAVSTYGSALEYASPTLRDDREIVLAAVRQDGDALQYASKHLKKDPELLTLAAAQPASEENEETDNEAMEAGEQVQEEEQGGGFTADEQEWLSENAIDFPKGEFKWGEDHGLLTFWQGENLYSEAFYKSTKRPISYRYDLSVFRDARNDKEAPETTLGEKIFRNWKTFQDFISKGSQARITTFDNLARPAGRKEHPTRRVEKREKDPIQAFRLFMKSQIPEIGLQPDKKHGQIYMPKGFLRFEVKKDHVQVFFRTKESIKPNAVFKALNASGILLKPIYKKYMATAAPGSKNANIVTIETRVPIDSKDNLTTPEVRKDTVELYRRMRKAFIEIQKSL